MKPRTIIGFIFIVASLLKLATSWGILHWSWFETMSEGPWAMYFCIFILLCVGVHLIIDSYRRDPDQWLQRPLPIGEDGKRIRCSVHYGGDEYVYHRQSRRTYHRPECPYHPHRRQQFPWWSGYPTSYFCVVIAEKSTSQ